VSSSATALGKYRYRRRLPHLQKTDADLFVTFCAGGPLMLAATSRDLVLEHCLREGGILPLVAIARIHLYAVVIMPDHVHFLLRPLRDPNGWPYPLVDILQCLKGATAHRINKLRKNRSITCSDQTRV
jgi:putative transposase